MLDAERRQRIVAFVEQNKGATVAELCGQFGVSQATVRRDLTQLNRQGVIERAHGGATPKLRGRAAGFLEPPIVKRASSQAKAKRQIGHAASKYVEDGDVIIAAPGTTTAEMIRNLTDRRNLTVITNALNIASLLASHPNIDTIVTGGILRHSEVSMLGSLTEDALSNLQADKLFLGSPAIDVDYGLSTDHMIEGRSDRTLMASAREVTVLADHTKFGRVAMVRVALLAAVKRIVTDSKTPTSIISELRERGVEVDVAGRNSDVEQAQGRSV